MALSVPHLIHALSCREARDGQGTKKVGYGCRGPQRFEFE
jgi:hypothetical protein